jgi:hypothetical protein
VRGSTVDPCEGTAADSPAPVEDHFGEFMAGTLRDGILLVFVPTFHRLNA